MNTLSKIQNKDRAINGLCSELSNLDDLIPDFDAADQLVIKDCAIKFHHVLRKMLPNFDEYAEFSSELAIFKGVSA